MCRFEAMNSNRAINDSVVEARFKENLEELAAHDRFKDFGQINLLILLNDPQHVFYVMDGQHRLLQFRWAKRRLIRKQILMMEFECLGLIK